MRDWPLVGRDQLIDRIVGAAQHGVGTVIVGATGRGKSALAREAGVRFEAIGRPTELVLCRDPADLSMHRLLTSDASPVVALVDDAHLLSEDAADRLWRRLEVDELVVVATLRHGAPMPDGVVRLWTGGRCERLDLDPLTGPQVQALLVMVLGGDLEDRLSRALHERSGGNPLLLREIVRAAQRSDAIVHEHGLWRLDAPLPVGEGLTDLIGVRLAMLGPAEREGAELIALGEPLPLAVADTVIGAAVLEALEAHGVIRTQDVIDDTVITVVHPLFGEVLRATLAPLRSRRLRRTLIDALECDDGRSAGQLVRTVLWHLDLGTPPPARELLRAAQSARAVGAGSAERLARAALAADGSPDAALTLAEILVQQGRVSEVEHLVDELDPSSLDAASRSALLGVRALARIRLGELAQVAALHSADVDGLAATQIEALYAQSVNLDGRPSEAAVTARPLVADSDVPAVDRCLAGLAVVSGAAFSGCYDEAVATVEALRQLFAEVAGEAPFVPSSMEVSGLIAATLAGHLGAAEKGARRLYDAGLDNDDEWLRPRGASALGVVALTRGCVRTATRYFRITVASLNDFDGLFLRYNVAWLARAAAAAGLADEAHDAMQEVGASAPVYGLFQADWVLAEAAVLAAEGHLRRACEQALDAARMAASGGMWGATSIAAFDALRYGGGQPAADLVVGAAERVDGPLPLAMGRAAKSFALDEGVALDCAGAALEERGALLYAADIANLAAGVHSRAGDGRAAVGSALRSAELHRRCEGAWRPWAVPSPLHQVLTEREREVAILAACGRSDAELSAELSISIRTVQSHLARTYTKLGISGRRGLADALAEAWSEH